MTLPFLLGLLAISLIGCTAEPVATVPSPTRPIEEPSTELPPTQTASPTRSASRLRGSVRIWLDWTPKELRSLDALISSFMLRHPEVDFSIAYFPADEFRSALVEIPGLAVKPTMIFGPAAWGPELYQEGISLDLAELTDAELEATIHPLAWQQVKHGEVVLGEPLEMLGVVLYRNRAVIAEPVATITEWIAASQALRDQGLVGSGLDYGFLFSTPLLSACGGTLFDASGAIALDRPEWTCWLIMLAELRQAGRINFNDDLDFEEFINGTTGWLIDGTWRAAELASALGGPDLVVDPWPSYLPTGEQLAGYVWTENAYLIAGASLQDREASWAFIRYLLTPEAQLMLSSPREAAHLPTLLGLALDDAIQAQMLASLSSGISLPLRADLEMYAEPIEAAVLAVAIQGSSPELALEVARTKIDLARAPEPTETAP
jgi:ABC-type glycerol-3-phosphate transport system substrate-binding protein